MPPEPVSSITTKKCFKMSNFEGFLVTVLTDDGTHHEIVVHDIENGYLDYKDPQNPQNRKRYTISDIFNTVTAIFNAQK